MPVQLQGVATQLYNKQHTCCFVLKVAPSQLTLTRTRSLAAPPSFRSAPFSPHAQQAAAGGDANAATIHAIQNAEPNFQVGVLRSAWHAGRI